MLNIFLVLIFLLVLAYGVLLKLHPITLHILQSDLKRSYAQIRLQFYKLI